MIPNAALFRDDAGLQAIPGLNGAMMPTQATGTLLPRFYVEVERLTVPAADGREYREVEYVEILQAGDTKSAPIRRVTREWLDANPHFQQAYGAWKQGQQVSATGTPLEDWTGIGRAQVAAAKALHIFTVEQLAELNDHGLRNLGMGARELQAKARHFLERRQDEAAAERAVAENVRLQSQLDQVLADNAGLNARLAALESAAGTLTKTPAAATKPAR